MKSLVMTGPKSLTVIERDQLLPKHGELLLKLLYVGFCGSDLKSYLGVNPMAKYPLVPGHEISAVIVEAGKAVPESYVPGALVTVIPYTDCGQCPACIHGRQYACQFNQTLGVQRDGAMQEYITVPWKSVLCAPRLNEQELALVEPLTVGFHAVERCGIKEPDTVMVIGCGMIGTGAIIRAAIRGATVIAVDIDDRKLETARLLGAKYTINTYNTDLHESVGEVTGGKGPDVVVEAVGAPVTYRAAIQEAAFTGRVACIGYAGEDVPFPAKLIVQKELDILGSRNATRADFQAVLSFLEQGSLPLERMITQKVSLSGACAALESWAANPGGVMKLLLDFTGMHTDGSG